MLTLSIFCITCWLWTWELMCNITVTLKPAFPSHTTERWTISADGKELIPAAWTPNFQVLSKCFLKYDFPWLTFHFFQILGKESQNHLLGRTIINHWVECSALKEIVITVQRADRTWKQRPHFSVFQRRLEEKNENNHIPKYIIAPYTNSEGFIALNGGKGVGSVVYTFNIHYIKGKNLTDIIIYSPRGTFWIQYLIFLIIESFSRGTSYRIIHTHSYLYIRKVYTTVQIVMIVTRQSIVLKIILRPDLASVGRDENIHAIFLLFLAYYLGNMSTVQNKIQQNNSPGAEM